MRHICERCGLVHTCAAEAKILKLEAELNEVHDILQKQVASAEVLKWALVKSICGSPIADNPEESNDQAVRSDATEPG